MGQSVSESQALKDFIQQVRWLYEPEFGDFKRKVGLYLERLEQSAPTLGKGPSAKILNSMKTMAVYSPNGDIESTRQQLLELAERLSSGSH